MKKLLSKIAGLFASQTYLSDATAPMPWYSSSISRLPYTPPDYSKVSRSDYLEAQRLALYDQALKCRLRGTLDFDNLTPDEVCYIAYQAMQDIAPIMAKLQQEAQEELDQNFTFTFEYGFDSTDTTGK